MPTNREMTDKQKVQAHCSTAVARAIIYPTYEYHWIEWNNGKSVSSTHPTEAEAWADAASKLPDAAPSAEPPPRCRFCSQLIRETHMGQTRNEWEHLNGQSFCYDGKHWAWPSKPSPIAEPAKAPMSEFFRRERPKFSESGRVYRRFCTCMCHRTGAKHVMACCLPDPPFSGWPLKAKSAPQPVIDDAPVVERKHSSYRTHLFEAIKNPAEAEEYLKATLEEYPEGFHAAFELVMSAQGQPTPTVIPDAKAEKEPLHTETITLGFSVTRIVNTAAPLVHFRQDCERQDSLILFVGIESKPLPSETAPSWQPNEMIPGRFGYAPKPSEPAEGERGVKPCLCGASPCIGVKKLRTGYACIREVGLATLAAKDEKVEESSDAAEVLRAVDATLCACRRNRCERPADCNCDIQAAHRLIDDYFRELKKRSVGGVK